MRKLKNKKVITMIIAVLVIVIAAGVGFMFLHNNKESNLDVPSTPEIKEELVLKDLSLETGSEIPGVEKFISSGVIETSGDLIFERLDETVEDKSLQTMTLVIDDEEGIVDTCPEGSLCEEQVILVGTGTYKVTVTINDKLMEATLTVVDTIAPTIETQDVTITEGETVTIASFIKSCKDNSHTDCSYRIINMDNEAVELAKLTAGTHKLVLVVTDDSTNEVRKEVTLTINKKEEQKPQSSSSSNNSSSSSNKNNSSSSNSSSNKNNSSSNNNNSSGSSNSSSNTGSSSSNGSSSGNSSSKPSNTCTYYSYTAGSIKLDDSKIGKSIPFYKKWDTPVHYSVAEDWLSKNSSMALLNQETMRMPVVNWQGSRTWGAFIDVKCKETGDYIGFVMAVEYYPAYLGSDGEVYNDKQQGLAYLNSSGNPVWAWKNFTPCTSWDYVGQTGTGCRWK